MYFRDAVLKDTAVNELYFRDSSSGKIFKGDSFEGALSIAMAEKLLSVLGRSEGDSDISQFGRDLERGVRVMKSFKSLDYMSINDLFNVNDEEIKARQDFLASQLSDIKSKVILPISWTGSAPHSVVLVLENTGEKYNLTVINTGDGLDYHQKFADPAHTHPCLARFWIEFKDIDRRVLFSNSCWFLRSLLLLDHFEFMMKLEAKLGKSAPLYFYGSLLSNFKDYLSLSNINSRDKLLPPQRSGSCTISSLMAALHFYSKDDLSYHYHRIKIGHNLLEKFLNNYENDQDFKRLISDGFDSVSRKLFASIPSALAQHLLSYLERLHPGIFTDEGKLSWKVDRNIFSLSLDESIVGLMRKSISLSQKIHAILERITIDKSTTIITEPISNEAPLTSKANCFFIEDWQAKVTAIEDSDVSFRSSDFLSQKPERILQEHTEIYGFIERLESCQGESEYKFVACNLDVFRSAQNKCWWSYLSETTSIDLAGRLLDDFKFIMKRVMTASVLPNSLDDLVLFAHLQIGVWSCAVIYDDLQESPSKLRLGLRYFKPPPVLELALIEMHPSLTSVRYKYWPVLTSFSPANAAELDQLLQVYNSITMGEEYFIGPKQILSAETGTCHYSCDQLIQIHREITTNRAYSQLFTKMMKHPLVADGIRRLATQLYGLGRREWSATPHNQLGLFLMCQQQFEDTFKQFFDPFTIFIWMFTRIGRPPFKNTMASDNRLNPEILYPTTFLLNFSDSERLTLHFSESNEKFMKFQLPETEENDYEDEEYDPIDNSVGLVLSRKTGLFHKLRHSDAAFSQDFLAFESWLNFIKSAPDATIFDSPYFLYLSDRLLNMPNIKMIGEHEDFDSPGSSGVFIDLSRNSLYFAGFDRRHIKSVYNALSRLIQVDLTALKDKNDELDFDFKDHLIRRAGNLGILLKRFMERLNFDEVISPKAVALMLAKLYSQFEDFIVRNKEKEQFAAIHFTLAAISSVKLPRSSCNFIEALEDESLRSVTMTSLTRVHWFLAKMHFEIREIGKNLLDDAFNYGIPFEPVANSQEIEATKKLLKKFLVVEDSVEFYFHENGDLVKLKFAGNSQTWLIQLSSGRMVKNGLCLPERSIVYNSPEFQTFFHSKNDQIYAKSFGQVFLVNSTIIFLVPDYKFKGNLIVILHKARKSFLFRKYKADWYNWNAEEEITEDFKRFIGYKWIGGHKLYTKVTEKSTKFLVMKDEEAEPLLIVENPVKTNSIVLKFPGFPMFKSLTVQTELFDAVHKSLRTFTDTEILITKGMAFDQISFGLVYPALYMASKPLIILYGNKSRELALANQPEFIVDPVQASLNENVLTGTLVIKTRGNNTSRSLLIPVSEKNDPACEQVIQLERVPLIGKVPEPQTLLQRLLLAFVCIKNREFAFARDLLHPCTSIVHNEPFSPQESNVLSWIVRSNVNGPEAAALKILAYIHIIENSKKFPLNKISTDSLTSDIQKSIRIFSNSVRELSEKFQVLRHFPDFMASEMPKLFSSAIAVPRVDPDDPDFDNVFFSPLSFDLIQGNLEDFDLLDISVQSTINFLLLLHEKHPFAQKYLDLMRRLIIRNDAASSRAKHMEMILFCAAETPEIVEKLAQVLHSTIKAPSTSTSAESMTTTKLSAIFRETLRNCSRKHEKYFEPISMSKYSEQIDPKEFINTLQREMKRKVYQANTSKPRDHLTLVTHEDLYEFRKISDMIKSNFKTVKLCNDPRNHFRKSNKSKVLRKLLNSIDQEQTIVSADKITLLPFLEYLKKRIKEIDAILKSMTLELLKQTTGMFNESHMFDALNRFLHQKKTKTFENLYNCYQKQSVECLQSKFTQFSVDECSNLLEETTLFYSNQVLLQYFSMLSEMERDDLFGFLAELEKIEHFNLRLRTPTILNFEYRSKQYRLKAEQVDDIEELTTDGVVVAKDGQPPRYKSVVIQRMMAAGKTLILGTISTVIKAQSQTLSILIPPSSLYQSNLNGMQDRTYKYFKTVGHTFLFPRLQFVDDDYILSVAKPFLKLIKEKLVRAMQAQEYFILSPETLQSFLNSFIEVLNAYANSPFTSELDQVLTLYLEIYGIFRTFGSIILDEIDLTMDPKKELNFPTAETEPFNMHAAILLADLIEFSVFSERVHSIGLDLAANNQSSLSSENYRNYLKVLFEYIEKELNSSNSLWYKMFSNQSSSDVLLFLKTEDMSVKRSWIKELDPLIADAIIIVKAQLWSGLKDSMKSAANLNYGVAGPNRSEILYAVPYLAANTPSPSSEFADRWETLQKTLMMLAATPCSLQIAKNMIGYIRKKIVEETGSSLNTLKTETVTFKNVSAIIPPGIDPLSLRVSDQADVELIHEALMTRSPCAIRLLFSYALDEIFSKMKFPVEQITSNALNMTSMFASVQGYSGTIDNVNILPRRVEFESHLDNEKNNGGIALKLIEDFHNAQVHQLNEDDLKRPIQEIVSKVFQGQQQSKLSAIIDVGAFFKNFKNLTVAESILFLLKDRIHVVLYYDEISNQVKFVKQGGVYGHVAQTDPESIFKATQCEVEHRFTFYDQRHITGSDIPQPIDGSAVLTVGPRVLLRDILQGTLRMRKFMTSQTVQLVSSEATFKLYQSRCGSIEPVAAFKVSNVLELGAMNEDEKQLAENRKLAFSKIDDEIRSFILDEIVFDRSTIASWFKSPLKKLFIRTIREDPLSWMTPVTPKPTHEILSDYVNSWLAIIQGVIFELDPAEALLLRYESLENTLNSLLDPRNPNNLTAFLNETLIKPEQGSLQGTEVEMQLVSEVELNLEMISEQLPEAEFIKAFVPINLDAMKKTMRIDKVPGILALKDVLNPEQFSKIHRPLVENVTISDALTVGISEDLVDFVKRSRNGRSFNIFSHETLEGSHLLIQRFNGDLRVILVSLNNAATIKEQLQFMNSPKSNELGVPLAGVFSSFTLLPRPSEPLFWLCDLSGSVSITNDPQSRPGEIIYNLIPQVDLPIFDLLIFNGSLDQILASSRLYEIYQNRWIQRENSENCSKFLLLRMHCLAKKAQFIFPANSSEISTLKKLSQGIKVNRSREALASTFYNKPAISESSRLPTLISACAFDPVEILAEITEEFFSEPSEFNEEFNLLTSETDALVAPPVSLSSPLIYDSDVDYFFNEAKSNSVLDSLLKLPAGDSNINFDFVSPFDNFTDAFAPCKQDEALDKLFNNWLT